MHVALCQSTDAFLKKQCKPVNEGTDDKPICSTRAGKGGQNEQRLLAAFACHGVCQFLAVGQSVSKAALWKGTNRTIPLMDALSDNGFSKFNGHGAHKRAIATEAAQDLMNGDSQLSKRLAAEDDRNTLGFATTVYHPHTCVAFSASHQEIDKLKSVSEADHPLLPIRRARHLRVGSKCRSTKATIRKTSQMTRGRTTND